MGVVHIDHKTNHGAPKQKRHNHAAKNHQGNRLLGDQCSRHRACHPNSSESSDQQAVFDKNGAACWHFFGAGENHFFPPNLDHVVKAWGPTASISAVKPTTTPRQLGKFFLGEWRPHKVETFEIGVTMVDHVMANVPQAESGERRQKGDAPYPFVKTAMWRETLVASVMANDEQTPNGETHGRPAQQLGPQVFKINRAGKKRTPYRKIQCQ